MNNFINTFKNMQPRDIVIKMIQNNNNPMINNLIKLAENGNTKEIENIATNLLKEQGLDFNKEFNNFMNNFK